MGKTKKKSKRLKEVRKYGAATRKMREGTLGNGILWVEKQRQSEANEPRSKQVRVEPCTANFMQEQHNTFHTYEVQTQLQLIFLSKNSMVLQTIRCQDNQLSLSACVSLPICTQV